MSASERVIRSRSVVLPSGIQPAAIAIRDGKIAHLGDPAEFGSADTIDFGKSVIMPGIVDTHVHINEPGRTEWEGFESATMAAAAGGVTTLIDMPLNSIPALTNREALRQKVEAAQGKIFVDVGFWGGVVPGNTSELANLHEQGVFGFKCFLVPSGVPEFEFVAEQDLRRALPELAQLNAVLLVHAESPEAIQRATAKISDKDPRCYATWLDSHPGNAEDQAIELLVRLAAEYRARVHVVHLSSAPAAAIILGAKERGINITTETCPHYLTLAAEEIADGATEFKCAPPARGRANRELLWTALRDGIIDMVVTDHSPAPSEMKCRQTGNFLQAWGGIASLQLSLPILWTSARERGFGIEAVVRWLCYGPAKLAGLRRKGEISIGHDADFVVWNPEESFQVRTKDLFFRHKLTPYRDRMLFGKVRSTFLRGEQVYASGKFSSHRAGRVLRRGEE
jgi:allantoinase